MGILFTISLLKYVNLVVTLPNLMEKLESVQYSAALAVSGTWKGTSREKLYAELGWESLSSRRWSRRLILFHKFINNLAPKFTTDPIPPLRQSRYSLRKQDTIGRIRTRTEKLQSTFYPHYLSEWNKLDPEIRLAPTIAAFKTKLLSKIRPLPKSVFRIHDPTGLSYLTQLKVGLSKLNFHKFKHNFREALNPKCALPTMALRIRSTSCCSALLWKYHGDIFSLESPLYYDHLDIPIFQTSF